MIFLTEPADIRQLAIGSGFAMIEKWDVRVGPVRQEIERRNSARSMSTTLGVLTAP
jgi:hypothetical protein